MSDELIIGPTEASKLAKQMQPDTAPSMRERLAVPVLMAMDDLSADSARSFLASQSHSGDCTKDAWTCAMCRANAALDVVDRQLAELESPSEGMLREGMRSPREQELEGAWRAIIQHIKEGGQ